MSDGEIILAEGKPDPDPTVKEYLTVQTGGRRQRLADWEGVLDTFLTSNELPRLQGAGSVSAKQAERIAHDRYAAFDEKRKAAQALAASETDELEELKRIADGAKGRKKGESI